MKLFLSHAGIGEVRGGVEVYAQHLKKVFPDLETLDYHSLKEKLGDTSFSLLKEPLRAKKLGEYVSKNYPETETIFTNGMFCSNLESKNQFNICHGSYPAFALRAVPLFNPDHYRLKYIYGYFEKKAAQNANVVISNSANTKKNVKKYFNKDSKIIYPPVSENFSEIDYEKAREQLGWRGTNILFVGRAEYTKGFDLIEKIAAKYPELNLKCILSRNYSPKSNNLTVIETVEHKDLPMYYSACDVVLSPSRFEGFGFVTIEALACNKKIVTLNTGIASEIEHENLFVTKEQFLENELMRAISAEAKNSGKLIQKMFSFENFSKEWKSIISKFEPMEI